MKTTRQVNGGAGTPSGPVVSKSAVAAVAAVVLGGAVAGQAQAADCENLRLLKLPDTVVNGAQTIPAGS